MELSLDELATEPEVTITDSHGGGGGVFSLVLVDPDFPTPSNPKFKHTLYWCVNNILAGGAPFSASDFTVEYMPPDTPAGKGVHRHVFMLYRQAGGYDRFTPPHRRVSFQIKEWAKQHHMTPVAAVYFKVRHE